MDRVDYAAYAKIYDDSSLPFCILQTLREQGREPRDLIFRYVNRACSARIGAEPSDMCGRSFSALIGRLPNAAVVRQMDSDVKTGLAETAVAIGSGCNGPFNVQYEVLGGGYAACYITHATAADWLLSNGKGHSDGFSEALADQLYLYRTTENAGVFRVRLDEDLTLLYGNDRYYDLHEYSEQSMLERLGNRCVGYIYPDDLKMVRETIAEARSGGRRYAKWVMRVITGTGSTRYMQTALSFSEAAGEPVMEGTVIDVTEQMRVQERLEAARREIDGIIRSMPGGLVKYVYDGRRLKAIYCSEGFGTIMGKSVEEYKNEIEKNGWECNVYPGDIHLVRHALEECAAGARDIDIDYRMKHRDGHYVWVNVQAKRASAGSSAEINAVFHNLSVSSELYQMLLNNTETIVMVGDLETREMLYANKAAADFAGRDPDEVTGKKCYEYMMHSETPCEFCNPASLHTGVSTEVVLSGRCFDVRAEYIKWNGRDAYVEYVNDITNSWKIKNQLAIDREKLDTIINRITTGIAVYRQAADGKLRLEGCNDAFCELFHISRQNAYSLDENGVYTGLHPDDFDRAKDSFLSMFSGERRASFDFRAQIGGGYSWLSLSGISVAQPDGSSLAYVSYMDISKQKAAEEELSKNARLLASALAELRESHRQLEAAAKKAQLNFDEELKYQSETQSDDLLVKVRCNLTQDVVESYIARNSVGISFAGMSYTDGIEALAATGYTEEERAMIRRMLNTERVLKSFQDGDSSYSMDYRRVAASGNVIWVNTTVKTYQDLRSGDVKSFMYTVDIDRKKVSEGIISTVAAVEHDFVMLIDLNSDEFYVYTGSDEATAVPPKFGRHYANAMRGLNAEWVAPEDAERAAADMTPERIRANLADGRAFSAVYRAVDKEGARRHKKIEYFWLAGSSWQVILTRSDVTDLIMEQQRQQELLKNALCQAEQASMAKTDFLSKMSHEIRTPMNAIIGMNALAAQSLNDPERAANYISKAGFSSRYLLALINDILDMSRIESGKVNINSEKIPFEEFLRGINAICYGQALEKHISYDSIIHGFVADAYFGDAMKLQQILVNLLGNAVKFTPDGGKVQLIISQERIEHGSAYVKFTVNDTGVGISEPFQKVMFEPFEQEHSDITSPYGGTGLGLAITKNLVTLMGGTINVSSILGIGTEFNVTLPLGICEERPQCLPVSINLAGKRALVVDDEVLICQQMKDIFDELGMESEWAGSGVGAVEEVQRAQESGLSYELIIIDWKMPEIDGVETARRIRSIVGDDVTIIIMTAYDVNEVESAAKEAGVNLVVTKPLFRSSLTAAFERIYLKKAERKLTAEPPADYDFSGKHILVVEDHPMNVEVARRLLEAKGADVEVAENGLIAIETYAARPVGYFDAILMDIRMPVMDGLTATRSIRQMRKRTAKKIPIIAMSANAFDEDVERSLAAGMNAHLSKPIEPKTLYAALHSFINESGL